MSLVTVSNVAKSYAMQQVLQSVSFTVGDGEKMALVGRNGCGKSTLLRLIAGEETPDDGSVTLLPRTFMGYLAQDPDLSGGETLYTAVYAAQPRLVALEQRLQQLEAQLQQHPQGSEAIYAAYAEAQDEYAHAGGPAYAARVKATLAGLGFHESDYILSVDALSGGQRTRASLCMLLLQEPDLLLLDEPTNHLDLPAIEWLEDYLIHTRSAVLVVSHDRFFLDRVVTRVVEIEDGRSYTYPGNYTTYARLREERLEQLQIQWERNQQQVEKLQAYINRNREGVRATQAKSREKALARLQMEQPQPRLKQHEMHLNLKPGMRSGDEVLQVERMTHAFGEKALFSQLEFTVMRGDRVGIVGPNGSGKTTFLRILMGQQVPDAGHFRFGANVEPGYFAQDLSGGNPENSLLDEILDAGAATYEDARSLLARFLFTGDDVLKRVGDLSGGERNRLTLARLLLSRANVLLLDEPTNHLDIAARDRLEEALISFEGTVIFSSHDRYLLDRVATRILEIADGQARLYNESYADYRRHKERELQLAAATAARAAKAAEAKPKERLRPRNGARPQDVRRAVKMIEEQIAATEARIAELSAVLADTSAYSDGERIRQVTAEYEALNSKLPELVAEWERLAEAAEAIAPQK